MIVNSADIEPKLIDDYDFVFLNGVILPVTVDTAGGDTVSFGENIVHVYLNKRPSQGDPSLMTPAENLTIYKTNLAWVSHKQREVIPQTPEQKEQFQQLLKKSSKTVH